MIKTLLLTALSVTALASAPTAAADPATNYYLSQLDNAGIQYGDAATAVKVGHMICTELSRGDSVASILNEGTSAGFSGYDAGYIVGAASRAFCPEEFYILKNWAIAHSGSYA